MQSCTTASRLSTKFLKSNDGGTVQGLGRICRSRNLVHAIDSVFAGVFAACVSLMVAGCSLSSDDDISAKELKLVLNGPANAAPGVSTSGFTATLTQGQNEAVETAQVSITAEQGTVDAPPDRPGTNGGQTDSKGQLSFAFHPPATIATATTVKLSARAEVDGRVADSSLSVAVSPDVFQFTSPANGTSSQTGVEHSVPLQFQWTRKDGVESAGVTGTVKVSTDGGFLVLDGSAMSPGQTVEMATSRERPGGFNSSLAIASSRSGSVKVTVTDRDADARTAEVTVKFVDTPTQIELEAETLEVKASPDPARFSNLTARALNARLEPVPEIDVSFSILRKISDSANERVVPAGGITNENGSAASRFEAGPMNGTAIVQACALNNSICDTREIKVVDGTDTGSNPETTPASVVLNADPMVVTAAPSPARFSTITALVSNASGAAVANAQVEFTLTSKAGESVNERVLPSTTTTSADGKAVAQYEAGTTAGAAVVEACVKGTTICGAREISVVTPPP